MVKNAVRVYGSAVNIANFATTASQYWDVSQQAFANGQWDQYADFNNVFSASNVVATYAIKDYTLVQPNRVVTSSDGGFTFKSTHTDTGTKISVNSGVKWGAGFTITALKTDYLAGATLNNWPGVSSPA